jgi:hypothetical protein
MFEPTKQEVEECRIKHNLSLMQAGRAVERGHVLTYIKNIDADITVKNVLEYIVKNMLVYRRLL